MRWALQLLLLLRWSQKEGVVVFPGIACCLKLTFATTPDADDEATARSVTDSSEDFVLQSA